MRGLPPVPSEAIDSFCAHFANFSTARVLCSARASGADARAGHPARTARRGVSIAT
jgi:hypothetical protein